MLTCRAPSFHQRLHTPHLNCFLSSSSLNWLLFLHATWLPFNSPPTQLLPVMCPYWFSFNLHDLRGKKISLKIVLWVELSQTRIHSHPKYDWICLLKSLSLSFSSPNPTSSVAKLFPRPFYFEQLFDPIAAWGSSAGPRSGARWLHSCHRSNKPFPSASPWPSFIVRIRQFRINLSDMWQCVSICVLVIKNGNHSVTLLFNTLQAQRFKARSGSFVWVFWKRFFVEKKQ